MSETATDAFTPNIVWERALARITENERLREAAHDALADMERAEHGHFWFEPRLGAIRRWMERCG